MEQLVNGIEKLLWFVYRIIFILLPTIVFGYLTYLSLNYILDSIPNVKVSKMLIFAQNLSNLYQAVIILGSCVVLNSIIEAFGETYFNFDALVKEQLNEDSIYIKAKARINNILKEQYGIEEEISGTEITYLVRFEVMQNYLSFNNYVWFTYCNHKIASNTAIYILLFISIFAPPLFCIEYGLDLSQMIWLYPLQIFINILHIYCVRKMLDKSFEYGLKINLLRNEIIIAISLILGVLILGLTIKYHFLSVGFFSLIGVNLLIYSVIFYLFNYSHHNRGWVRKILIEAFLSINQPPKIKNAENKNIAANDS